MTPASPIYGKPAPDSIAVAPSNRPELAIVGAVPPPFGGVTIHIRRLGHQLRRRGISFCIINLNNAAEDLPTVVSWKRKAFRRAMAWITRSIPSAVIVINRRITVWYFFALVGWLRRQRIVVRLQGSDLLQWQKTRGLRRRLAIGCLRRVSGVVCVNELLFDAARELGVPRERLLLMPGFLPPSPEELVPDEIDSASAEFLAAHHPMIVANGKVAWHQGQDLYGLDMIVDLVSRLHADHPNVAAMVCLASPSSQEQSYLNQLKLRASEMGLGDRIVFRTEPGFFLPVLFKATIFVRPTNTEGDSNSVREALSLGIPTVASDVAPRPAETVLFRNRDAEDFAAKTQFVLKTLEGRVAPADRAISQAHGSSPDIDKYVEFLLGRPLARGSLSPAEQQHSAAP